MATSISPPRSVVHENEYVKPPIGRSPYRDALMKHVPQKTANIPPPPPPLEEEEVQGDEGKDPGSMWTVPLNSPKNENGDQSHHRNGELRDGQQSSSSSLSTRSSLFHTPLASYSKRLMNAGGRTVDHVDIVSLSRSATQIKLEYDLLSNGGKGDENQNNNIDESNKSNNNGGETNSLFVYAPTESFASCSSRERCPFCSVGTTFTVTENEPPDAYSKGWELVAFNWIGVAILCAMIYLALYLLLGFPQMAPGGDIFNLLFLWMCSVVMGKVVGLIGLPPLVGMIAAGAILQNIASLTSDGMGGSTFDVVTIPSEWRNVIRGMGLAVILLRSGLDLNLEAIRDAKVAAFLLTVMPGLVEACVCALVAKYGYGFPTALAFALGFILAAVSPAVVVSTMLSLKKKGYGVKAGIPSLVIAAASFDDVIAITGFSISMAIALNPFRGGALADDTVSVEEQHENHRGVWGAILHGPLSIMLGVVVGVAGAAILSFTLLWNIRWKRTAVLIILAAIITFGTAKINMVGSAAMGCLIMGVATSHLWTNGLPAILAKQPSPTVSTNKKISQQSKEGASGLGGWYVAQTEYDLKKLWSNLNEPLLFCIIGTALDFSNVQLKVQALVIVLVGLSARIPVAFLSTFGNASLNWKERLFVSLAWIPKATVQAALCSVPLEYVHKLFTTTDASFTMYESWAKDIEATAVLAILISAPVGLIFIKFLGKRLLTKADAEDGSSLRESGHSTPDTSMVNERDDNNVQDRASPITADPSSILQQSISGS